MKGEPAASSGSELARRLEALDGRGYRAYHDVRGRHALGDLELFVDHVQGDPFAAPSTLRVRIPMQRARLPAALFETGVRRMALADFLARRARESLATPGGPAAGSGRSGSVAVDAGGQAVLERSAVVITSDFVELRLEAGLPARGRRILGRAAARLLTGTIPEGARRALLWESLDADAARDFVHCVENQEHVRGRLRALGLVALVGDGACLPRESGASDRPLTRGVVPFASPPSLAVRIPVPNPLPGGAGSELVGMGIPRGVTLVVGGGYHGKSTLLQALARCVHPHVPGDGREHVVSDAGLVKVRAEDGRRVERVDIHGFVSSLPGGGDTRAFSSEDASGSTSQAAAIVEAMEAGATGLLLDEDTSATNFLVRDARMQALVADRDEPITPLVDRVRELYERFGVSTVLVMGGSGDYLDVADRVIALRAWRPFDVTGAAREIAGRMPTGRIAEGAEPLTEPALRVPVAASFDASRGRRDVKIDVPSRHEVRYGRERLDLRGVEQLACRSQTRAVALAIHLAARQLMGEDVTLRQILDGLDALLDERGLDVLDPHAGGRPTGRHPGNLARPRRFEVAAALDRLRGMRVREPDAYPRAAAAPAPHPRRSP